MPKTKRGGMQIIPFGVPAAAIGRTDRNGQVVGLFTIKVNGTGLRQLTLQA